MADKKENGESYKLSPEIRARMSAGQRRRHSKKAKPARSHRRRETPDAHSNGAAPELDEGTFGYALGYIESWLGTYAAAAGVPASSLASRVGKVLHSKARG